MPRLLPVLLIPLLLGGCALPVPIQIASLAIDGFLYLTTEKSLTDHGISVVSGQDCALHRVVTRDGDVCDDVVDGGVAVAEAPSEQKPEIFVDDKQIETIPWEDDHVEIVALKVPVEKKEIAPKSAETEIEVVDLWSNDVPDDLLPDSYEEDVAALPTFEASSAPGVLGVLSVSELNSLQTQDHIITTPPVPEIPEASGVLGTIPLSELKDATPQNEVVDLWSSDVPDHLMSEVETEIKPKGLYLAEVNHIY